MCGVALTQAYFISFIVTALISLDKTTNYTYNMGALFAVYA